MGGIEFAPLSSTEMSNPNEVSAEPNEAGSIGIGGLRLWKVVSVSGDHRRYVLGLCISGFRPFAVK